MKFWSKSAHPNAIYKSKSEPRSGSLVNANAFWWCLHHCATKTQPYQSCDHKLVKINEIIKKWVHPKSKFWFFVTAHRVSCFTYFSSFQVFWTSETFFFHKKRLWAIFTRSLRVFGIKLGLNKIFEKSKFLFFKILENFSNFQKTGIYMIKY